MRHIFFCLVMLTVKTVFSGAQHHQRMFFSVHYTIRLLLRNAATIEVVAVPLRGNVVKFLYRVPCGIVNHCGRNESENG